MVDDPGRYVEVIIQRRAKVATILSCQECGAIVVHRAVHDAWHEVIDAALLPKSPYVKWPPDATRPPIDLQAIVERIQRKARLRPERRP